MDTRDAFPWAEFFQWLVLPALAAGVVGAAVALSSARKGLATKRAFWITSSLGIVFGIVSNTVNTKLDQVGIFANFVLQVPISLLVGWAVAAACGNVIRRRDSKKAKAGPGESA